MMSFILDSSTSFFMLYNHVTVTVMYDVMLTPSSKFQNKSKRKRKIEIRKRLKIIRVYYLSL